MQEAYLKNAPKMIDFLHERTHVRYIDLKYPDYYTDKPGSKHGHRSMEPQPINMSELVLHPVNTASNSG